MELPFFIVDDIADDDAYLDKSTSLQNIGEIRVEIYAVAVHESDTSGTYLPIPEVGKVHERSQKALNHQVKWRI